MPPLNSLVQQPGNAEPPNVQGASGTGQASGLQGLVQGGGAPQGQGAQGPSPQETTAMLQHLSFFRRRWQAMLSDPEVGTKNMRPEVYDMMADVLSDDYASLPDVMGQLKTLPTNPLEQKQWIEKHVQQDEQATRALLDHYAANRGPMGTAEQELAAAQSQPNGDRAAMVRGAVSRFKANPRKPNKMNGIPTRG